MNRKSIITIFFIILILIVAHNFKLAIVMSESMEPTLNKNDLILVKKQKDYNINDIVVYKKNKNCIVHRIVEITREKVITKGDANNINDDEIEKNNIEGKVILNIHQIGKFILFIQNKKAIASMIWILIILILLVNKKKVEVIFLRRKGKHAKEETNVIEKFFVTIIFIILIIIISKMSNFFSKYVTNDFVSSEGSAGKVGQLELKEYKVNDSELVTSNDTKENIELETNSSIKKQLELSYESKDVASYLFFVINADNWLYIEQDKKMTIKGSYNVDIMYFIINDNWTYLTTDELDDGSKNYIFYHEMGLNEQFADTNIISDIQVNPVSLDDANKNNLLVLNDDHRISFSAYVIQKLGTENINNAWKYVTKEMK